MANAVWKIIFRFDICEWVIEWSEWYKRVLCIGFIYCASYNTAFQMALWHETTECSQSFLSGEEKAVSSLRVRDVMCR